MYIVITRAHNEEQKRHEYESPTKSGANLIQNERTEETKKKKN